MTATERFGATVAFEAPDGEEVEVDVDVEASLYLGAPATRLDPAEGRECDIRAVRIDGVKLRLSDAALADIEEQAWDRCDCGDFEPDLEMRDWR